MSHFSKALFGEFHIKLQPSCEPQKYPGAIPILNDYKEEEEKKKKKKKIGRRKK